MMVALGSLVAIGAIAALACYPAVAHADEAGFMAAIQSAGLMLTNPSTLLAVGHQICDDITTSGVAGVSKPGPQA
jgi:hypothetical protein